MHKLAYSALIGSLLVLTGANQSALATNYFSWGAETMTPTWGANGSATGSASLRSSTTLIDSTVAHSGSKSMRVSVNMVGTNESVGIDLNGTPPAYPFNLVGSQLYYRWWMKIQPGFSWGDAGDGWVKIGRVMTPSLAGAYYTGFMAGSRFIIQECNYRDGGNYVGDCHTTAGTPSLLTAISIPYNLAGKADGQWHEYISRIKVNTSASCTPGVNCDAQWEMYVDGASVGSYKNFKLTSQNSQMIDWWGSWGTNPYFQGKASSSAGGTIYFDDFSTDDTWNSLVSPSGPGGSVAAPPPPAPTPPPPAPTNLLVK